MAAPSGTTWGSIAGGYGRIGIDIGLSSTATQTTVTVSTWFWSKYSISDSSNSYYYNNTATSATTKIGSIKLNTTNDSGSGWSTSNQVKLGQATYTYNRGTSDVTRACAIKLTDVDRVGATMTHTRNYTVPKLASYTIKYNANGGTGAPGNQTKYYGVNLKLSTVKPTRTGYSFQGWALTEADADAGTWYYAAGATCGKNENLTLYATWKANTYVVTYDANGGTGAPENQTKTHDVTLKLSTTIPKRTNYNFLGWATPKGSTTVTYAAGANYASNATLNLYAVWSLAYKKPTITGLSISRCTSNGTPADDGTYAKVVFNWTAYHTTNKIVISCESSVNIVSKTINNTGVTSGSVSEIIGGEAGSNNALSVESPYTIRVVVSDSGGQWAVSREIPGAKFAIDILIDPEKGPQGIAFGGSATAKDYADFSFKTRHRGTMLFNNNTTIHAINPDGDEIEVINPINANGNFVLGWGNYDLGPTLANGGNTNIYGYDVNFGISNLATPGSYRPYRRKGDSWTVEFFTAGYVTNAGKHVTFWLPLTEPIIGSPTATVSGKLTLRQGAHYTHGSSASVGVVPDSYTASVKMFNGISITAAFTDITNVTNNDAIGVYWSGTIVLS